MKKNIIITIFVIVIALGLGFGISFFLNKDVEPPTAEFTYEDISITLTTDWDIFNTEDNSISFYNDSTKSIIDNFLIYTYKNLHITDIKTMLKLYQAHVFSTGYATIETQYIDTDNLGTVSWIKYNKQDIIKETVFFSKNERMYSITTIYNADSDYSNPKISNELLNIIKNIK